MFHYLFIYFFLVSFIRMEVLFEGQLERCNLSSGKEWKRGYGVLRKHPVTGSTVLEFYKDSHWTRSEPKAICNLLTGYNVVYSSSSNKKRFVFELKTTDQSYELGTTSDSMRQRWVQELNSAKNQAGVSNDGGLQNMIQAFNVVLLNEEYSKRHLDGYVGTCQLLVTDAEVIIVAGGQTKIRWKFSTIRRYKSQTGTFIIEVGRKAPTGEGEYRFDTVNPVELFDVLDKAVKDRVRAKGIEISTLPASSSELQQSKLPPVSRPIKNLPQRAASMDDEYSHLDKPKEIQKEISEYDHLFNNNKDHLQKHRNSEPTIKPHQPPAPFLHNSRPLTVNTPFSSNTIQNAEEEETYEDMNASLKDDAKRVGRPLPPPRSKGNDEGGKIPLAKSVSTPAVMATENTYDLPTKTKPVLTPSVQSKSEYDSLFNKNNKINHHSNLPQQLPAKQEDNMYSHLNHNSNQAIQNTPSIQTYEQPKPKVKPPSVGGHQLSIRKPVTKPKRPAPSPPVRANNNVVENKTNPGINFNLSGGSTSSIIEQLKKRNKNQNVGQEALYDVPGSKPPTSNTVGYQPPTTAVGYNEVGDLIPGQYQVVDRDSHGYVSVPDSKPVIEDEGIYQVAK